MCAIMAYKRESHWLPKRFFEEDVLCPKSGGSRKASNLSNFACHLRALFGKTAVSWAIGEGGRGERLSCLVKEKNKGAELCPPPLSYVVL